MLDTETLKVSRRVEFPEGSRPWMLRASPDGKEVWVQTASGTNVVLDSRTLETLHTEELGPVRMPLRTHMSAGLARGVRATGVLRSEAWLRRPVLLGRGLGGGTGRGAAGEARDAPPGPSGEKAQNVQGQEHHDPSHDADHQLYDRTLHATHVFVPSVMFLSPRTTLDPNAGLYRSVRSSSEPDTPASTVRSAMSKTSMILVTSPVVSVTPT